MENKELIKEIMHGLSNKDLGENKINQSENDLYFNIATFPQVTQMEQANLLLVKKIKKYSQEQNAVVLQTEGRFFSQQFTYRYFDFRPVHNELKNTRNICIKLLFVNKYVVRIQMAEGFHVPDNSTEMIRDCKFENVSIDVSETEKEITISSGEINVTVTKDPWNLKISDKNGREFYRQFSEEQHSFMKYEICPFGFLYDIKNNEKFACEAAYFNEDEHFYGFGEKYQSLEKKGQALNLWNTNALGTNTERGYKNIPFFISSNGYGVFYNTSRKIKCDMGNSLYKAYSIMAGAPDFDCFVIYGPTIKDILPRYTDITGKPVLAPKWSFGLWISKISYGTRQEVETVARRMREEDIPCDVIHIDTDWFDENWVCNWKFSEKKFPQVEEMISNLNKDGFKISLWQLPYLEKGSAPYDVFDEGMEKGYFAFCEDGDMKFHHGLIDFSNPEAVDWYKNKLLKPLLEAGISAIKVDFGESAPPFFKYNNCMGEDMHNLYALLYNKAVFEVTEEVHGKGNALIWARSAWAGSQKYPVHWGGDAGSDFYGLASSIKGGLSLGLSGFPLWSHDIGGFWFETNPVLYARWSQVGMFSSHARLHGFFTREPWAFGEEVKTIFKKYAKLRYRLMPYIYSASANAVDESLPMFRALVVDYQYDPAVTYIDNQYLFGESFMVAPILDERNERDIYLPEGLWTDYWDKKQYNGKQWIKYHAELDKLPLFVRQNSIVPMGPEMNYIDEKECDPITIEFYPVAGKSNFDMIDTDSSIIQVSLEKSGQETKITISPTKHHFELIIYNTAGTEKVESENEQLVVLSKKDAGGESLVIQVTEPKDKPIEISIIK